MANVTIDSFLSFKKIFLSQEMPWMPQPQKKVPFEKQGLTDKCNYSSGHHKYTAEGKKSLFYRVGYV